MSNEVGSKQPLTVPPQRSGQAQGILSISRDAEVLQSFLRVDLGLDDEGDAAPKRVLSEEISPPPQSRPQEGVMERREREKARLNKVPSNRTKVGKTTFSQLTKDIKLKQGGEGGKKKKKGGGSKAARIRLQEEVYTDKDRAAAVVMGSRDIKQSLKMKRKQDRSLALQIPEEAEPGTLLALGSREMRSGDVSIAINFMHKALELNPNDKNALVARSKCYLLLGEPNLALKDAETALQGDKTFIRGLFQKAESLYHLGDFEHSLMYYHRGLRIRPELEGFRLGVQKAQEAIENTIGSKTVTQQKSQSLPQSQSTAIAPLTTEEPLVAESKKQTLEAGSLSKTSRPVSNVGQKTSKSLLGELCVDKEYLEQLLRHPDIKCLHQQKASNNITMFAEEGVAFLNNRQEFWRQQRPSTASTKKMIKKSPHATTNNTRLAC